MLFSLQGIYPSIIVSASDNYSDVNKYNLSVEYNESNNIVTVSGRVDSENAGKKVTLMVLNPTDADEQKAYTLSDISPNNLKERVFAVRQDNVTKNGSFSFTYKWTPDMTGGMFSYKVAVSGIEDDESERTITEYFSSNKLIKEAVLALNSADISAVAKGLADRDLGLDTENSLFINNAERVAYKFISYKGDMVYTDENDLDKVKSAFEKCMFYTSVDAGDVTVEELEQYYTDNSLVYMDVYSEIKDSVLNIIAKSKSSNITSDAELKSYVDICTILALINEAGRETLISLIENNNKVLEIAETEQYAFYSKCSETDKIAINARLTEKEYITV